MKKEAVYGLLSNLLNFVFAIFNRRLFTKKKTPFATGDSAIEEWTSFYRDYFGLNVDLSSVVIPHNPGNFNRIIIVARELFKSSKGRPYAYLVRAIEKCFQVRMPENIDKVIVKNSRWPKNGSYAIRLCDQDMLRELDYGSRDISNPKIPSPTCFEMLLYSFKYFTETGKQLDQEGWTWCLGSHSRYGHDLVVVGSENMVFVSFKAPDLMPQKWAQRWTRLVVS